MARLQGKVALITGAGRGIGREIALLFALEGARVAILDTRADEAEGTCAAIQKLAGEGIVIRADVAVATEVDGAVAKVLEAFGRIDILVNNAGIGGSKTCVETLESDWDRMVAVNLKSVFLLCKRVLPEMMRVGKGKIINIASMYGILGSPHTAAYSVSKAGVINFTRQLAVDYSGHNICVNAISPGLIETEMTRHKLSDPIGREHLVSQIPVGRQGTPADIAGAALFLAGEESDFITGHNLVVDGGQSCRII
jgi:NAD(P)-dependent dehydrogenase (short-subunit alcohol dehydrogenase family)